MSVSGGAVEHLDQVPPHVWSLLPTGLSLRTSAVDHSRIGVWASDLVPQGRRFGPFLGEKKKRSQVTSNVYMWEVYFPARGWLCVDATDPLKGNWLRYVNWARSEHEQNLFPLEVQRHIYYKALRPIRPGEELLVRFTVEDKPEITAALEEERASGSSSSSRSRKKSARPTRAKKKLLERVTPAGLGGFKKTSGAKTTVKEMWHGEEGMKEEDGRPSDRKDVQLVSVGLMEKGNGAEEEEEEIEEEEDEEEEDAHHLMMQQQIAQHLSATEQNKQSVPSLTCDEDLHKFSRLKVGPSSLKVQEPDPDLDLDPDPDCDLEIDLQGESHPCQHCERHFSTRQGLERHIHIHAITNQQTQLFKCRYCSKAFGSQVGRRRHERRHENGPKKRPGSLAGTATPLSPDGSSPDCTSPTGQYSIVSQFTAGPLHNSDVQKRESGPHADRPYVPDDGSESKELHPCKYCSKAFGTHTNMRRHQRRIHERHLLPKGVRRKGMLLQEAPTQQQKIPDQSPSTSPPMVYVPSADTEDEADRDDYAIDISKNISENLSFYIDGKIVSSNSVSSCDVIEVDSRSAALFGLDTVIISPNQISQALKAEGRTSAAKQVSNMGQPSVKRRTSTPPFIPSLKVETESAPFTASSASSSSSTSSSSNFLVGGLFQQAADSSTFLREKTVYLSPKLKQLLQTQDMNKSTIALITDSHRLASPLTLTQLPGASGRFKRRTASPPSSPQLSPACKTESCKAEGPSSYALKVPKLEGHSASIPGSRLDKDDGDAPRTSANNMHNQTSSDGGGGGSCNQLPLDLSNTVTRKSDGAAKAPGDSALDLSLNRKSSAEPDAKGSAAPQPLAKKRKPNTSMLEKVLMNEYVGLSLAGEEGPLPSANLGSLNSQSPVTESANPSPPSLTPVTMNPSSPGACSMTSPTPPPPVLPTVPSPPATPGSPLSQPSDMSTQRPLPVLSPEMSPRSAERRAPSPDSDKASSSEEDKSEAEDQEPLDGPDTPVKDPLDSLLPGPSEPAAVDLHSTDVSVTSSGLLNGSVKKDHGSVSEEAAAPSPQPESSSPSPPPPPLPADHTRSPSQSLLQVKIKEEPLHCVDQVSVTNHAPRDDRDAPAPPVLSDRAAKTPEKEETDPTYCKAFVCNVCEEPFNSIKELSGHIAVHAADWPFKCEFCVQLFGDASALLAHRTALHGVGRIFVCSACSKEFAFLCNLQQHQKDLHPNETCSNKTVESGKLRPQNYTDPSRAREESGPPSAPAPENPNEPVAHSDSESAKDEPDVNGNHAAEDGGEDGADDPNEELYTTIKIMASEGGKAKGPDVRLGINQHYPSYKPPPFPYHSRSHAGSVASATNFTTHNIPQTFSTAIRCTKCGNSFDNMPELHKHILACANASDKKRYTPKKNPIPLKQIVKSPNGVVSPIAAAAAAAAASQSAFRRMGQPKRLNFNQDAGKTKMSALSKKKNQLVQKAISQRNRAATTAKKANVKSEEEQPSNVCPHCSREFTYTASLNKHMVVSCPMKPVVKKGKKGPAEVKKEGDKSMSLRKKASDGDAQEPERKTLGKTRARSSGAANPEPSRTGKGKSGAASGRLKRPASFPAPVPPSKKPKKGQVQSLPPSPAPAPDTPGDAQRPAQRLQRAGKEAAPPKKSAAAKPLPPPTQPPKKEERFSMRTRERVGGPVTRSLQSAAPPPPAAEVRTDETPQEPKNTQDLLTK